MPELSEEAVQLLVTLFRVIKPNLEQLRILREIAPQAHNQIYRQAQLS